MRRWDATHGSDLNPTRDGVSRAGRSTMRRGLVPSNQGAGVAGTSHSRRRLIITPAVPKLTHADGKATFLLGDAAWFQSDDVPTWFGILAIAGAYFIFSDSGWGNSLWYSVQYGVGFGDVQTDTKPSDCDFLHAPLGEKGCSYKAHVQVYNADGLYVVGEKSPVYRSDTETRKPIVSFDRGETWEWYDGATIPNLKPKFVRVYWAKG